MSNSLKSYALYAEIISALAVIASLIFVASEVRLNTQSIQVSAYQDLIEQIGVLNTVLLDNPDIAVLDAKISAGNEPENEVEEAQLRAMMRLAVRHADMAYYQYENGLIDELRLRGMSSVLVVALNRSAFERQVWKGMKVVLLTDFSSYIERRFEDTFGTTIEAKDT